MPQRKTTARVRSSAKRKSATPAAPKQVLHCHSRASTCNSRAGGNPPASFRAAAPSFALVAIMAIALYSFFSVVQAQSLMKKESPQCSGFVACTQLFFGNLWRTITGNPTSPSLAQAPGNPEGASVGLLPPGITNLEEITVGPVPSKEATGMGMQGGNSLVLQPMGMDNVVIGQGQSSPQYKLDVFGDIRAYRLTTNDLFVNGIANVSSLFAGLSISTPLLCLGESSCLKNIEDFGPWKKVAETTTDIKYDGGKVIVGDNAFVVDTAGKISKGTWEGNEIDDAYVSDTLTASNLVSVSDVGVVNSTEIFDGTIEDADLKEGSFPKIKGVGTLGSLAVTGEINTGSTYLTSTLNGTYFGSNATFRDSKYTIPSKNRKSAVLEIFDNMFRFRQSKEKGSDTLSISLEIDENGSVGIGTGTPNASAILDMTSTTKGFLPPRMTTGQMNAISSNGGNTPEGLTIYNSDDSEKQYRVWNGSVWDTMGGVWKKDQATKDISYVDGKVGIGGVPADGYDLTVGGSIKTGVINANKGVFSRDRVASEANIITPQPILSVIAGDGGTAALDIGGTSNGNNSAMRYWRIAQDNDTSSNYKAGRLRIQPIINTGNVDPDQNEGAKKDGGITILRNGHVGIGTQNPDKGGSFFLTVAGDINLQTALLDTKNRIALAHDRIGLDVAEVYQADTDVEVGDVLVVGHRDRTVQKSSRPYEADIIGVVSGSPALLFEGSEMKIGATSNRFVKGSRPPVALAGRVPVKVSLENGSIRIGDYLTSSSTPGVAMRATEPGTALGIALESYSGNAEGQVLAFVNIGERNMAQRLRELEKQIEILKKKMK